MIKQFMESTNLDIWPVMVPNPPPWKVNYLNDESTELTDVVPSTLTEGLNKLGLPELIIRYAPPNIAAAVLDRLGAYLAFERKPKVEKFTYAGIDYKIIPTLLGERPVLRLAWDKDPERDPALGFSQRCQELGIKW
jgi:hypothetical protein